MAHDPPAASSADVPPAREGLLLVVVALGAVLAPLNSTMIAVALPSITTDLGVGVAATGWLVTAYLIAMASLQPVAGRLGDRLCASIFQGKRQRLPCPVAPSSRRRVPIDRCTCRFAPTSLRPSQSSSERC